MDSLDLRVNRVAGNSRLVATRGGVDFFFINALCCFTRSDSNERRNRGGMRAAETGTADRRRSWPSSKP